MKKETKTTKKVKKVEKTTNKKGAKKTAVKKVSKTHEKFIEEQKKNMGKYDSATEDNKVTDKYGNWDGSTITDDDINAITDPRERALVEQLDRLQEEIREIMESGDKDLIPDKNYKVMEANRIRAELNEINPNKYI